MAEGTQVKVMTSESMRTLDFPAAQMLLFQAHNPISEDGPSRSQSFLMTAEDVIRQLHSPGSGLCNA